MSLDSLRTRLKQQEETKRDPLVVRRNAIFSLTVDELRKACETNPDHPLAKVKVKSVAGMPLTQTVHVERVDLECILDNCEVELSRTEAIDPDTGEVRIIESKKVGKSLGRKAPTPAPAPSK